MAPLPGLYFVQSASIRQKVYTCVKNYFGKWTERQRCHFFLVSEFSCLSNNITSACLQFPADALYEIRRGLCCTGIISEVGLQGGLFRKSMVIEGIYNHQYYV